MGDDKELLRSNTQKNFEIKTDMQKNMGLDANQMKNGRPSLPGQEQLKKTASKKTGKIKELNREVPGNEIKQLPQVGKVRPMTKDEIAALKKVYNQKDKDIHVAALMELLGKNIEDAPKERNDVIFLKQPFLQKVEGGDGFVWAPGTNPLIIEHIDWLMEYFKINDDSIADYKEEHEDNVIPELPVNEYMFRLRALRISMSIRERP